MSGGCKLIVGENCTIKKGVSISLINNATVKIGNNCVIEKGCVIECRNGALIDLGDNSHIGEGARLYGNWDSSVTIGNHFSCTRNLFITAGGQSICMIGEDCMFSRDINLQCMDAHNYFDLDRNMSFNLQKKYKINVGKHVWVGAGCKLLYGADIGAGSIVGMGSFVNKSFPNNIVITGNPARCVRKDVAWNRASYPFYNDRKAFEAYDFRKEDVL